MDCVCFHDSRNTAYRYPFGAVPTGTAVTLHLDVTGDGTEAVFLRLWVGDQETLLPMTCPDLPAPADAGEAEAGVQTRRYGISFQVPEKGCLVWYFFEVRKQGVTCYYGNNKKERGGKGQVWKTLPPSFQITVYDAGSVTPDWLKHAVIYQIFPDRFCRGKVSPDRFMGKEGAVLHSCWQGEPCYVRDKENRVLYYDFYGGTLEGILEKLDYLQDLGVTCLYFNPVFQARSNHRYDTGDYKTIDPFLGDEKTFRLLCEEAKKRHVRIILDGVFSHTGADSRYFNRLGTYGEAEGAYRNPDSPYASWYRFTRFPDEYRCWWGDRSLPEVEETESSYLDYIIYGEDSVLKHWMRAGISGWRLDVADELPDGFLEPFYRELKKENPDAALIGEVWEDASHKVSYGKQRQYLSGGKLDSVMNYVLRGLMLDFALNKADAAETDQAYWQQMENYPRENFYAMMNLLGSHDVERLLTVLENALPQEAALRMEGLLWAWQMTLPGAPAVYYGDEAGLRGGKDPENRGPYPWGRENHVLQDCCRSLIHLRRNHTALETGRFATVHASGNVYVFCRFLEGSDLFGKPGEDGVFFTALNRGSRSETVTVRTDGLAWGELEELWNLDTFFGTQEKSSSHRTLPVQNGCFTLTLPPYGAAIYRCREKRMRSDGKSAGILLHPTSLPGLMGREKVASARKFIDFMAEGHQKIWQILPLTLPGLGNSPYLSLSAFAGYADLFCSDSRDVDAHAFAAFRQKQAYWLDDYALFMALREHFHDQPWQNWPDGIRQRRRKDLHRYRALLSREIDRYEREQYLFFETWKGIRQYAHQKGIRIFGDMPIFVAPDSADTWAHPEYFNLDSRGFPAEVAGVPPDYFSRDGQVWGNPLYRWDVMASDGFRWWQERFRVLAEEADIVRIDHFRGFSAMWTIDARTRDARNGHWSPVPGEALFEALKGIPVQFVAEDLGVITDEVRALKERFGFPGMKVLEFHCLTRYDGQTSFDTEPDCIAYTGTHDNNTLCGWFEEELDAADQQRMRQMVSGIQEKGANAEETLCRQFVGYLYSRRARTVIVPMQDLLGLPSSCRMNLPGTTEGNWQWQMEEGALTSSLATELRHLVETYRK